MKVCVFFLFILGSCQTRENAQPQEYTGPIREADNIEMFYTEKDHIKIKLTAKKILEFRNGDRDFPEGIYIEFFDETGKMTSTLKANTAYYFKGENQWRGRGKVEVKNIEQQDQLATEELFWEPDTKKIFTDKFVTVRSATEVIYGTGLQAAQDMSSYTITKLEGVFDVEEEP